MLRAVQLISNLLMGEIKLFCFVGVSLSLERLFRPWGIPS